MRVGLFHNSHAWETNFYGVARRRVSLLPPKQRDPTEANKKLTGFKFRVDYKKFSWGAFYGI